MRPLVVSTILFFGFVGIEIGAETTRSIVGTENSSVSLPCNSDDTTTTVQYWLLPDGSVVQPGNVDTREFVTPSGSLNITFLQMDDAGRYTCLESEGKVTMHAFYLDLQVQEIPEKLSVWDQNRTKFITAFTAAGCVAAVAAFLCTVYNLRWRPPKQLYDDAELNLNPTAPVIDMNNSFVQTRFS